MKIKHECDWDCYDEASDACESGYDDVSLKWFVCDKWEDFRRGLIRLWGRVFRGRRRVKNNLKSLLEKEYLSSAPAEMFKGLPTLDGDKRKLQTKL